jgi:hypothetical protein
MISITSPTRTAYSISIEQGQTVSGTLSFSSRTVSIVPKGGETVSLVEAVTVDGAIQNQPKESN